jgi:hypothetical protein
MYVGKKEGIIFRRVSLVWSQKETLQVFSVHVQSRISSNIEFESVEDGRT